MTTFLEAQLGGGDVSLDHPGGGDGDRALSAHVARELTRDHDAFSLDAAGHAAAGHELEGPAHHDVALDVRLDPEVARSSDLTADPEAFSQDGCFAQAGAS